jgi:HAD superfamily hydrolase (TIGR01549 family)
MVVKALLLDLDKTLVNVEDHTDYCAALRELEARGFSPRAAGPETYWGKCTKRVMDILISLEGGAWSAANEIVERYELWGAAASTPMPYLAEFLEAVKGAPKAVVTLLSPCPTAYVLQRHGIAVDAVVAREPGIRPKPSPDPVLKALERLGVGEAVMVGDSEWDEAAANAAGVPFVAVTNGRTQHRFKTKYVAENLRGAVEILVHAFKIGKT